MGKQPAFLAVTRLADKYPAFGLLVVAAVIALVVGFCSLLSDDSDTEPAGPDEFGAIDVCHQRVEDQLRSPATAEFSGEDWSRAGDTYTVTGAVDSENGFGALIRSQWHCEATWVEGTSWRPVIASVL